jgi:outer membrane protein insertion porin family
LLIREQPVIRDVQVTGNRRLGSARLAEAIEFLPGTPVDRFELDRAARRLEEIYRDRGFYLAEVTVNTDVLDETGVILFEIREGTRVRITGIRFDGNEAFSDGELRGEIETHKAGFFRRGRLDRETLAATRGRWRGTCRTAGYLDARVDTFVQPSPERPRGDRDVLRRGGPAVLAAQRGGEPRRRGADRGPCWRPSRWWA